MVLFYPGYVLQFMRYHMEKATFTNNLIFGSFNLGSKLNFLVDFIKNKKCKKGLKNLLELNFARKEN